MKQPLKNLVTVILPVRNGKHGLKECLDSLLAQTYGSIEIIAIDDNSKDSSYAILKQYRRKDKRIIISRNVKHYGMQVTLNRALKKIKGEYIAFMNQNDTITPDKIKRQVNYLKRHPKVVAVGTQAAFIDRLNKNISKSVFPTDNEKITKTFLTADSLQLESILINRLLIPRDLLKFDNRKYPHVYRSLIAKLLPYGLFANLNQHLYIRTVQEKKYTGTKTLALNNLSLWLNARFVQGTGIPWNSLLYPINNKVSRG